MTVSCIQNTVILFLIISCTAYDYYWLNTYGTLCNGTHKFVESNGTQFEIIWDLNRIYDNLDHSYDYTESITNKRYSMTLCGAIDNDDVHCSQYNNLCFEISKLDDGTCIEPMGQWDDTSLIEYYLITDVVINTPSPTIGPTTMIPSVYYCSCVWFVM